MRMLWLRLEVIAVQTIPMNRTFTELSRLKTFDERFAYLKLNGVVGEDTFGFDRWINQTFYRSAEWKSVRRFVIARDHGCDLACDGYEIHGRIIIHHMNPIKLSEIVDRNDDILNPEYLISTTLNTHNAIHYGDTNNLISQPVERTANDTIPWR